MTPEQRKLDKQLTLQWSEEYHELWRLHTLATPLLPKPPFTGFKYECAKCGASIQYPTHYCPA